MKEEITSLRELAKSKKEYLNDIFLISQKQKEAIEKEELQEVRDRVYFTFPAMILPSNCFLTTNLKISPQRAESGFQDKKAVVLTSVKFPM